MILTTEGLATPQLGAQSRAIGPLGPAQHKKLSSSIGPLRL